MAADPASFSTPVLALPFPPLLRPELGVALRPWGADEDDAAVLARAWLDPDVVRWCAVPPEHSEAAAARWIRKESMRRAQGMALDLVITAPSDPSRVCGEVGLAVVEADRGWAEVGYWVLPEARGRGLASAAVGVFADWALRELPLNRLFARTLPENPASGRVAERAGFVRAGQMDDGVVVWILDQPGAVGEPPA